jgi:hypothetical protein
MHVLERYLSVDPKLMCAHRAVPLPALALRLNMDSRTESTIAERGIIVVGKRNNSKSCNLPV